MGKRSHWRKREILLYYDRRPGHLVKENCFQSWHYYTLYLYMLRKKKVHIRCVFADTITLQRCLMARLSDGSQILNCLSASEFLVPCMDLKVQSGYKISLHGIQYR